MLRSITMYQLVQATQAIIDRLEPALQQAKFKPCTKKQAVSQGFVSPLGAGEIMTYGANGGTLLCLRIDEKVVPPSAVKEKLAERRRAAEESGKPFSAVDERVAKEQIVEEFLPGIPPATRLTFAYIDIQLHMLIVGASEAGADEFTAALGKALNGTVPARTLGITEDPCDKFTAWVRDAELLGEAFTLGTMGAMKHEGGEGGCGVINFKHEDVEAEEILSLIEAGRKVCSIQLSHPNMDFRITSKLGIRNIELSDSVKADAADEATGEVTRPNEFAAFVSALRCVLQELEPLLGGWPQQAVLDLHDQQVGAKG